MGHAKVGDYIKIRDDNSGDWVKVGKTYKVVDVRDLESDYEKSFFLEGVDHIWHGEPSHYTIVTSPPTTLTHPKYNTFEVGDTVRRWRDVEEEEWYDIGEIPLPPIGEDVEVKTIDINNKRKEDSFYSELYGWFPMKAFVLAEYYNQSITKRGTAILNTKDHGKINQGRTIEVQRPSPTIVSGKRRTGSRVQSRGNATVVRGGYSSHKACFGR